MRRKLLFLNVALLAGAGIGLWRFRAEYQRSLERYKVLRTPAPPVLPPLPAQQAVPPPVQPANYLDAAAKFLFSADRNPLVAVEPPKIKKPPALPQLFGVMNLGAGPIALMAPAPNTAHKSVRIGEKIGDFKLLAAASDHLVLEWEGQEIKAPISELLVRPSAGAVPAGGQQSPQFAAPASGSGSGPAGATVIPSQSSNRPGEYLIGPPMQGASGTIYQSPPGDTAPNGTVFQNKRKVVRTTPFGQQSWWEDVKQ